MHCGHSKRWPQLRHSVERRVAAPVEKQQRLLALRERFAERVDEHRRQPAALLRRVLAQVDGRDLGHLDAGEAARKHDVAVAAGARVDVALDRRRRGSEDHREFAEAAAHHAHVARLIVDAVVLLEALIVLLVDDDETEILEGQEQRRARADDDAGLAGRCRAPGAAALGVGKGRVPFDRCASETRLEAVHELAGERDLGQHDQRLAPAAQRLGHGLVVDLGLARARHAVEQRDGEIRAVDGRDERVDGARLIVA